jgi:hypothetical protein
MMGCFMKQRTDTGPQSRRFQTRANLRASFAEWVNLKPDEDCSRIKLFRDNPPARSSLNVYAILGQNISSGSPAHKGSRKFFDQTDPPLSFMENQKAARLAAIIMQLSMPNV